MTTVTITPHTSVSLAFASEKENLREQRTYNTNFHTHSEISSVLPQIHHYYPFEQPWILLSPWLGLILSSRNIPETSLHRIHLPGTFFIQPLHASQAALQLGRISPSNAEELETSFPKRTERGDAISALLPQNQFFVRLDTCSLKDALLSAHGPVTNVCGSWTRLATSARGTSGIRSLRDASTPIYLYLFP